MSSVLICFLSFTHIGPEWKCLDSVNISASQHIHIQVYIATTYGLVFLLYNIINPDSDVVLVLCFLLTRSLIILEVTLRILVLRMASCFLDSVGRVLEAIIINFVFLLYLLNLWIFFCLFPSIEDDVMSVVKKSKCFFNEEPSQHYYLTHNCREKT